MIGEKTLLLGIAAVLFGAFWGVRTQLKSEQIEKSDGGKYSLKNCVNTFSMEKIEETKVGFQYWFVDKDFADGKTLKMSVVRPGLSTHSTLIPKTSFSSSSTARRNSILTERLWSSKKIPVCIARPIASTPFATSATAS